MTPAINAGKMKAAATTAGTKCERTGNICELPAMAAGATVTKQIAIAQTKPPLGHAGRMSLSLRGTRAMGLLPVPPVPVVLT